MKCVSPLMALRKFFLTSLALTSLGSLAACDRGEHVGVNTMTTRIVDGVSEQDGRGCILLERGAASGSSGGGGGGPHYAEVFEASDGHLHWEWWIPNEENVGNPLYFPSPEDGELVASFDEDMEFFMAGEVADIGFATHDGAQFKVHLWGTDDCEGDLEPPPGL